MVVALAILVVAKGSRLPLQQANLLAISKFNEGHSDIKNLSGYAS